MKEIAFLPSAFEDLKSWSTKDPKIYQKIKVCLKEMEHDPFFQPDEVEPLQYELSGLWARRLNDEHYLIYQVTDEKDEKVVVVSCRFYY